MISSAGLVNYYESEDRRAIQVNPLYVIALSFVVGLAILILNFVY